MHTKKIEIGSNYKFTDRNMTNALVWFYVQATGTKQKKSTVFSENNSGDVSTQMNRKSATANQQVHASKKRKTMNVRKTQAMNNSFGHVFESLSCEAFCSKRVENAVKEGSQSLVTSDRSVEQTPSVSAEHSQYKGNSPVTRKGYTIYKAKKVQ